MIFINVGFILGVLFLFFEYLSSLAYQVVDDDASNTGLTDRPTRKKTRKVKTSICLICKNDREGIKSRHGFICHECMQEHSS